MSGLHQFRSMTGTGGGGVVAYYALPNSGDVLRYISDGIVYLKDFEQFETPQWDGDDAKAVSEEDLRFARALLERLAPYLPEPPDAAPGADGSICMEWVANSHSGKKKVFVDVAPTDEVLTLLRLGENRPIERHFKKSDPMLIVYLQNLFDFFVAK